MFTGLVEETAHVVSVEPIGGGARLTLEAALVIPGTKAGDSIAVNGCCLTITTLTGNRLSFDLLAETLDKTNLGDQKPGSLVNLERAMLAHDRLGGHFVQGHVDTTSHIISLTPQGQDHRLEFELPHHFARYVAYKGSISVNGISLTAAEVKEASIVIWLIPHTMEVTNLHTLKAGDRVNLEFDMLAKYLERLVDPSLKD
ncbi:MAG: riboflavin synthase [Chthoniobacteraceae bacterium]